MKSQTFYPKLDSTWSQWVALGQVFAVAVFFFLVYLSWGDLGEMFVPLVFAVLTMIAFYNELHQRITITEEAISISSPLEGDKRILFSSLETLTVEFQTYLFLRNFRFYTLTMVDKHGHTTRHPMFLWHSDQLNDILDIIFQKHPHLFPEAK